MVNKLPFITILFTNFFHKTFRPTDQPMNRLTRRWTTKFLELLGTANKFKEKTDTQPDTLVDIATYRTSEPRARFIENLFLYMTSLG